MMFLGAFFLIFLVVGFVTVIGWQDQRELVGEKTYRPLTLGVFTAVVLIFLFIVSPR